MLFIWRDTKHHVYYDWFESGWCPDDNSVRELENFINDHVDRVKILKYEGVVPELVDEHWHVRNFLVNEIIFKVVSMVCRDRFTITLQIQTIAY